MSISVACPCLNALGKKNTIHLRWVKAHVGIHGNEVADFLAKRGTSLGNGPSEELSLPQTTVHIGRRVLESFKTKDF